jgi:hypothetical protein
VTGAELLTYMKRRLRLAGLTIGAGSEDENALMDAATEGRDTLRQIFAQRAPILVREFVTLEQDVGNASLFNFPAATKDPLKVLNLRPVTSRDTMIPSAEDLLDMDGGEYEWLSLRQVRVGENVAPSGGLEVAVVLFKDPITTATAEAAIGAPVPTHRAIGKYGALLYATADEDSDGTILEKQFLQEIDRLIKLYAQYDRNGGAGLRQAMLQAFGEWQGDTIY